jgi:Zn-dependent metalloprotease
MSLAPKLLSAAVLLALAGTALARPADPAAVDRALTRLHANPAAVRANAGDRFVATNTIVDRNGDEHVRFTRTYGGLDVIGGDFVMHSHGGALRSVSQTLASNLRPNLRPGIGADAAIEFAGVAFGPGFEGMPTARQVIFALHTRPTLAYEVVFAGQKANGDPTEMHFFVDAANGRILNKWDMVHTAKPGGGGGGTAGGTPAIGTGNGLIYDTNSLNTASSGGSYNMTDTTRGNGALYDAKQASYSNAARGATLFVDADNAWGNGSTSDRATAAVDAAYGVAKTWDFYKSTFNRNGIFNDGKGVKSYVHVGRSWVNAAWYANAMYYGDGGGSYLPLVALDIAGHEMSHGVTQAVNGLVYSNQDSGGLNEGSSDIMGTLVEFYAANPNDPGDYTIGEKIYATQSPTKALRYMFKPSGADPSYDCYPSGGFTNTDPHYSSGPANHFFYLLAAGAVNPSGFSYTPAQLVCNGDTSIAGIGNAKAGQIWYRAMDVYFTSGTTYPQARTATVNAATDLYGASSAEVSAVKAAWSAVGVN